ncbi:MAG: hypothetical protein FWC56_02250 [Phycisphaerae bacterium]|nr:hypothetical protein [Phycisphaerae bacterium]
MSGQSSPIILGQRISPTADANTSDLQQLVGKLLAILRYRLWLFVLPVLAGTLIMLVVSLMLPRQYTMQTVFERRDDPAVIRLVANSPYNYETIRSSMRFNLMGADAIQKALEQIETPTPMAAVVGDANQSTAAHAVTVTHANSYHRAAQLATNLTVTILENSPNYDQIALRYNGSEPALGEQLVNTLRDNYFRQAQHLIVDIQQQAQAFFAGEVEKRRTQAAKLQAEITQLEVEQPELVPGRADWLNDRLAAENLAIEQLNRQKSEITSDVRAREAALQELDEQQRQGKPFSPSAAIPSATMVPPERHPQQARIEAEIIAVQAKLLDAKSKRMTDFHPFVEEQTYKLKQLQLELERLKDSPITSTSPSGDTASPWDQERSRITMEMASGQSKLDQIEADLNQHQSEYDRLNSSKATLLDRQRDYTLRQQELDRLKADLTVWQSKLEEINRTRTAETMNRGTQFNTIEECRRPAKPTTPRISSTYVLCGGAGLGLGVIAVFLRELFDRSLRNPARVRQVLGIPVLETIGEIASPRQQRRRLLGWSRHAFAVVLVVMIVVLACLNYLSLENPTAYSRWTQEFSSHWSQMLGMMNG